MKITVDVSNHECIDLALITERGWKAIRFQLGSGASCNVEFNLWELDGIGWRWERCHLLMGVYYYAVSLFTVQWSFSEICSFVWSWQEFATRGIVLGRIIFDLSQITVLWNVFCVTKFQPACHFESFMESTNNFKQIAAVEIRNSWISWKLMKTWVWVVMLFSRAIHSDSSNALEAKVVESLYQYLNNSWFVLDFCAAVSSKSYSPHTENSKTSFVNLIIHSWSWKLLHYIYGNMITKIYSLSHTKATVKTL